MPGRPVFVGAVQSTLRLLVFVSGASGIGASGASGASIWSVTFSVTVMVSEPPLPSTTLTVTV